jgi:hypothetical protein
MKLARVSVLALTGSVLFSAYGCGGSSSCLVDCGGDESGGFGASSGRGGSNSSGKGGKPGASGSSGKGTAGSATAGTGASSGSGGSPSSGGSKAAGGTNSSAGSGAAGGSAPDAGSGGEAGVSDGAGGAPTAGSGGSAGTGNAGSSGAGQGGASSEVECEEAGDCLLFTDCCDCMAVSARENHESCELVCVQSRCSALQITQADVTCSFGRCVLARSCDASKVTCREAPPTCEDGDLPSVDGTCWGGCVAATECHDVGECGDCPSGTVCVEFQSQLQSFRCVAPGPGCEKGSYCECLPGACPNALSFCEEEGDQVVCPCPTC